MEIQVWICPECRSYYGGSMSHDVDLTDQFNYEPVDRHTVSSNPAKPKVTSNRAQCHACRGNGKNVQRKRIFIAVPESVIEDGLRLYAMRRLESTTRGTSA